ncbi:hypothetical protein Shyhy01_60980 [Streptomyces hygroscopicus subsp. hygroscopicus]|nr:hypothetical protein Shyhy01_60980 [Streptomyces hygroscopicus subsp. hygroscopicus]
MPCCVARPAGEGVYPAAPASLVLASRPGGVTGGAAEARQARGADRGPGGAPWIAHRQRPGPARAEPSRAEPGEQQRIAGARREPLPLAPGYASADSSGTPGPASPSGLTGRSPLATALSSSSESRAS